MAKNGQFAWADVSVPEPVRAREFYGAVFGWHAQELPDAGGYGFFLLEGQMVAGFGPQQDPNMPPSWTSYVYLDDIDGAVGAAREHGARVIAEPMDVMDAGRMAIVLDPAGAVLGLWQQKQHTGADRFNDPGFMTWNELMTRDIVRARGFYSTVLPWTLDTQTFDGFEYTMVMANQEVNGGMFEMPADMPAEVPSHWVVYFRVADADAAVEKISASGGAVLSEPQDSPYGRMAVVADPFGAPFAVIGMPPES